VGVQKTNLSPLQWAEYKKTKLPPINHIPLQQNKSTNKQTQTQEKINPIPKIFSFIFMSLILVCKSLFPQAQFINLIHQCYNDSLLTTLGNWIVSLKIITPFPTYNLHAQNNQK